MPVKNLLKVDLSKVDWDGRVKVYWNSTKKVFSVIGKRGIVIAHKNCIFLKDCRFVVREGGRQRVLKEKKKNVHAFVEGTIDKFKQKDIMCGYGPYKYLRIEYNPYKVGKFVYVANNQPVHEAACVFLMNGRIYEVQ